MRPAGTENDLYNYHLRQLVSRGLIAKQTGRYSLTSDGTRHIIELNPVTDLGESHRFKLASLCIAVRGVAPNYEVLSQLRLRQPDAGERGFVGGGIKRGELATAAAARRLYEEAGLYGTFTLLGMLRKRRFDNQGNIISDILFHVCLCQDATGELVTSNAYGEQSWIPLPHALANESTAKIGSPQLAFQLSRLFTATAADIPIFYIEEDYQGAI